MKREIKSYNSTSEEAKLEITDAGMKNKVWLNVQYERHDKQKSYIVVDVKELNRAINDIVDAGLI